MAKVIQVMGGEDAAHSFGRTQYFAVANGYWDGQWTLESAEAGAQTTYRTAGTLSGLRIYVTINNQNGATVLKSRVNGADGSQSLSTTASTTGEYADIINSDSISAGDEVNGYWDSTASSSGQIAVDILETHFAATTNTVARHAFVGANNLLSTASALYWPPAGSHTGTANTVETHALSLLGTACTVKNLFVNVTINTYNAQTDYSTWIDTGSGGVQGACITSIAASTTGIVEDTSNSDSLAAGDLLAYYNQSPSRTSGFQFLDVLSVEVETTNKKQMSFAGKAGVTVTQAESLTRYLPVGGFSQVESSEDAVESVPRFGGTATYMNFRISSNSNANDGTITFRVNGTGTALTFTVTGSATGTFSDTTNSATFASGDTIDIETVTGADPGFWSMRHWGVCFENTDPSGIRILALTGVGT